MSGILDNLRNALGRRVILAYRGLSGDTFYAKGILLAVDIDEQIILVRDMNNDDLYLEYSQILTIKVKDGGPQV
jgi:hypothetical protein